MRPKPSVPLLFALALLLPGPGPETAAEAAAERVSPLSIEINLPAYRLRLYHGEEVLGSYPIAIGARAFGTPRGTFEAKRIVWNPWWVPPDAPWARNAKRTPPGPKNPLGRVKIPLGHGYLVHGTSKPQSIGTPASHGCIRMMNADVIELATLISSFANDEFDLREIAGSVRSPTETRTARLERRVRVEVVYRTIELSGEDLAIHADVYRLEQDRQARLRSHLSSLGLSNGKIDAERLASWVEKSKKGGLVVSLEEMLRGEGPAEAASQPPAPSTVVF